MKNSKSVLVVAGALSLLTAACKINKDDNAKCLNPKAACYNKDTEAPTIKSTTPTSAALGGTTTAVSSLASVTVTFSEPMKNAGDIKNYPKPTNSGATNLTITSITKSDDLNYTINLAGVVSGGAIDFDLRALTDLSDNAISNGQFTITSAGVNLSSDYVSTGGYTSVTVIWKNNNTVAADYQFKKGGTSCTTGGPVNVTAGTNLSGLGAGVYNSGTGLPTFTTTINEPEVTSNPTTFRICLTNAGAGLQTEVPFDLLRDNTVPTLNTLTSDTLCRPTTLTLTCTDNQDKIAYRTDGVAPTFTAAGAIVAPAVLYPATGFVLPQGTTQFMYRCIDKAGNVTAASANYTFKSGFCWDSSLWSAAGPTPPFDVWK